MTNQDIIIYYKNTPILAMITYLINILGKTMQKRCGSINYFVLFYKSQKLTYTAIINQSNLLVMIGLRTITLQFVS